MEAGRSPNIEIITLAELKELSGKAGHFKAKLFIKPRYVDPQKCTACGLCTTYCPREVIDEYNEGLVYTKAARIDYPQAIPTTYYLDAKACLRMQHESCQLCANVCGPNAIVFDQLPEEREIEVGAVVLTLGFGRIPQEVLEKYGYGKYPDVMTSMEIERMTCASGPTEGEIIRPSDFTHPQRIAFLQCIGSRDVTCDNGYCSSVCCMYAMKEASVVKEHLPEAQIDLFFMDIRTQGKGFDEAFNRAVEKYGFGIIYARVPKIDQVGRKLALTYVTEDGKSHREFYDMVVLSVGLDAPKDAENLASILGIELNHYGFAQTRTSSPLETNVPGIFVAGAFQGPKDIPESVVQAQGVAARCSELLAEVRGEEAILKEFPPEDEELEALEPRVGVFVCHCGVNIASVVDVEDVTRYAANLPGVVHAEDVLYSCSQDALNDLVKKIKEHRLNRVVIAACSPRTHEPLFQETLKEAGLNPALIEMANIRDQCSWVHYFDPQAATAKAKDQVRMAVAKALRLKPLETQKVKVTPSALVIGGGAAGLQAALSIAEQGYEVHLVERERELGGNLRRVTGLLSGEDPQKILETLIKQVESHKRIRVYKETTVENISGYVGNFTSTLRSQAGSEIVNHGVVIIATGGKEHRPALWGLGEEDKILTQLDLEAELAGKASKIARARSIVMIQCVGSRGQDLKYCSKLCCQQAVKNALRLKKRYPKKDVYVLYGNMRTYGFSEDAYREAREAGVIFLRFTPQKRPELIKKGKSLYVKHYDALLGEDLLIPADVLVLSVGIAPGDNEELSKIIKAPLTSDGFFLEAHVKLMPVELAVDGVYVCGLAHGPKPLDETLAQARAAAAKATIPLAKGYVEVAPIVSRVDQQKCIGCGICADLCPYGAIQMIKVGKRKKAETITASCKGCGICASHCPVFAIEMGGFTDEAILAQIEAFGDFAEKESQEEAEKAA
ncbi:pyridine nucleotide-disulfide oxidoreductase [Thermodesulfatator autotrophicus]|uniref:Pyridine nucleotide-disulfide oxidoreductase n=1 Tax=Thermodesulfatator autotrophicus TaxID=1795632 RepID=A0A177E5U5_9BACT|nr:pyridine nucleotide-disulfide oxidoreductase [Thermodesulfatator autotrophicus]